MEKIKIKSFWIILGLEMIILLALLPGCFAGEQLKYELAGEYISAVCSSDQGKIQYMSEPLELAPGVYQIRIYSHMKESESIYAELKSEQNNFKAILGNGVSVSGGQDYADFEVYVTERVKDAEVLCEIDAEDAGGLERLTLSRLNLGNRMTFALALVLFGTLDFLVIWWRKILDGAVSREQQWVFWGLVGAVLLAYFPLLTDYFILGHDASLFYPDLFLLIPVFLRWIGFPLMWVYKIYVLLLVSATAFLAYFSFHKCTDSRMAALFGSVLYVLSPYYLVNLYSRGALGEVQAMAFLPLVACGLYMIFDEEETGKGRGKGKWYLVVGMSAVLQSHLVSAGMAAFFILLVCLVCLRRTIRPRIFRQLAESVVIVALVNCWFWLPMLVMLGADDHWLGTISSKGIKGYRVGRFLQLLPNMGTWGEEGLYNGWPATMGAGVFVLFVCFLAVRIIYGKKPRKAEKISLGLSLTAVFMCTAFFPWPTVSQLPLVGFFAESLQFAWRFLALAALCSALFGSFFYDRLQREMPQVANRIAILIVLIAVGSAVYQLNDVAFCTAPVRIYTAENMETSHAVNGEYILAGADSDDYSYHAPIAEVISAISAIAIAAVLILPRLKVGAWLGSLAGKRRRKLALAFVLAFVLTFLQITGWQISMKYGTSVHQSALFQGIGVLKGWQCVLWGIVEFLLLGGLIYAGFSRLEERERGGAFPATEAVLPRYFWAGVCALLIGLYLVFLIGCYPGFYNYDGGNQLIQVMYEESPYDAHHPLLHTMLMGGIITLGYHMRSADLTFGIFLYCAFQMAVSALCFTYALHFVWRRTGKKVLVAASFCFYALCPPIVMFAMSTTKDVLCYALLLVALIDLYELYGHLEENGKKVRWIRIGVLVTISCLFRNNIVYAVVILAVGAVLAVRQRRKAQILLYVCIIGGCLLVNKGLMSATHALAGSVTEAMSVPLQQIARLYREEGEEAFTDEELELLFSCIDESMIVTYDPFIADNIKFSFWLHLDTLMERKKEFAALWVRKALQYPDIYVGSFLDNTYQAWYPGTVLRDRKGYRYFDITEWQDEYGRPKLPWLYGYYEDIKDNLSYQYYPFLRMFFSIGVMLWLSLVTWWYGLWRKDGGILLSLGLVLLICLTSFFGPVSDVRYYLILFYMAPVCLGMMLGKAGGKGETGKVK